jgi:prolyl oligopeptidase
MMIGTRREFAIMYLLSVLLILSITSCGEKREAEQTAIETPVCPETRISPVTDTLHGTPVFDPYRWLEDGESAEVIDWTKAQNDYTHGVINSIPDRDRVRVEMEKAMQVKSISAPRVFGGRFFYERRSETQDQSVLYTKIGEDGEEKVLVDPNTLSDRGIVSLDWYFPSNDGALMAYGLSESGDEQSTLKIINTDDLSHIEEVIPRTSAASVAWLPDNSGFYYTRYPTKGEVPEGEELYHRSIFLHKLGTDPATDQKIFGDQLELQDWPSVLLSESGRYLAADVFRGWSKSEIYINDLHGDRGFVPLVKDLKAYSDAFFHGDDLYIRTNFDAPNYRVLKASLDNSDVSGWQVVVPEDDSAALKSSVVVAERIALNYVYNASSLVKVYNPENSTIETIDLPDIGSVYRLGGDVHGSDIYFSYVSFFIPTTIYRYPVESKVLDRYDGLDADVDPAQFETEFVGYESADGTRITMFIIHKKGTEFDGHNPTILTGYGGFNSSETPHFSHTRLFWLRNGGVLAVPHLRGGGEYGEKWHKAGMLANKQNVFDDFIAAAEYLVEKGYTNPEKLAIWGGSNGGLLVGAVETQRPDLFKAVVCGNPLLDMIRYQNFLIAKLWIAEYGSSDDPDQFEYIYAYSPYHHVENGTRYPATLILTSDSDARVDPFHARKMTARLQAVNTSDAPQLLRFEFEAGHGAGMPIWKKIDRYTDIYSFVVWQLGVEIAD